MTNKCTPLLMVFGSLSRERWIVCNVNKTDLVFLLVFHSTPSARLCIRRDEWLPSYLPSLPLCHPQMQRVMDHDIIRHCQAGRHRKWCGAAEQLATFPALSDSNGSVVSPLREWNHGCFPHSVTLGLLMMLACLISGMTIPEEDADVGQGSKYCLVAIGRLQVGKKPVVRACYCEKQETEFGCLFIWKYHVLSICGVMCLTLGTDKAEPGDKRRVPWRIHHRGLTVLRVSRPLSHLQVTAEVSSSRSHILDNHLYSLPRALWDKVQTHHSTLLSFPSSYFTTSSCQTTLFPSHDATTWFPTSMSIFELFLLPCVSVAVLLSAFLLCTPAFTTLETLTQYQSP